jgi:hypothetical protein
VSGVSGQSGRALRVGSAAPARRHPGLGLGEVARGFRWNGRPLVPESAQPFRTPAPAREFPTAWRCSTASAASRR